MKMMSSDFQQAFEAPGILVFNSPDVSDNRILGESELSFFSKLIRNRRSLPVYRDGYWRCYECPFESRSLGIMAPHVLRAHRLAPLSDEEMLEGIATEVG